MLCSNFCYVYKHNSSAKRVLVISLEGKEHCLLFQTKGLKPNKNNYMRKRVHQLFSIIFHIFITFI